MIVTIIQIDAGNGVVIQRTSDWKQHAVINGGNENIFKDFPSAVNYAISVGASALQSLDPTTYQWVTGQTVVPD